MKKVMGSIDELISTYRDNPTREMRCGSISCRDGVLFSYALPIARFITTQHYVSTFYILHDPKNSVTTNQHVRKVRWWLEHGSFTRCREVPSLYASEAEITEYYTAKLNRVFERFSRSKHIPTAYEYFLTHYDYAKHTDGLPAIPDKIRVLAELEGWYAR